MDTWINEILHPSILSNNTSSGWEVREPFAHYPSDIVAGAMIGVLSGIVAVRCTARQERWGRFRAKRRWRLIAVLVLFLVIPFASGFLHLGPLRIFLDAYLIPLTGLSLLYRTTIRP